MRREGTIYCDECGREHKYIYSYDGGEYCEDCLDDMITEVPKEERKEECDGCGDSEGATFKFEDMELCGKCIDELLRERRCKVEE